MKNLKQSTLSLAVFGLLAANTGYSLLSQGTNLFVRNSVVEGQVSLASTNSSLQASSSETDSILKVKALKAAGKASIQKVTDNNGKTKYFKVTIKDNEAAKYFNDSERVKEGFLVQKLDDPTIGADEIVLHYYAPEIRETIKVKGKDQELVLKRKMKTSAAGLFEVGKSSFSYELSEGKEVGLCSDCGQTPILEIDDISELAVKLEEAVKVGKKRDLEAQEAKLAKTCEDSKTKSAGKSAQIKCLIEDLEGRRNETELSKEDHAKSKDILVSILTEEYKEDDKSDFFKEYYKGNPKFKELVTSVRKDVKSELAKERAAEQKQEEIERQEELTARREEALQNEFSKIDRLFEIYSSNLNKFESYHADALYTLKEMEYQCTGGIGASSSYQEKNYFDSSFNVNVGFDFNNGIQFNNNNNNMMMNQLGGMNQFSSMNAQMDQMNAQYQQMARQNCLRNLEGTKNYYNWELAQMERTNITPYSKALSQRTSSLDASRIFNKTYKTEADYNGGLDMATFNEYDSIIKSYQSQFAGLTATSTGIESDILPRNNSLLNDTSTLNNSILGNSNRSNSPILNQNNGRQGSRIGRG